MQYCSIIENVEKVFFYRNTGKKRLRFTKIRIKQILDSPLRNSPMLAGLLNYTLY